MRNNRRRTRVGGGLMPAAYPSGDVQFTPGGGSNIHPNTLNNPTNFPSNIAKVSGRGCAGTRINTVAAKGLYAPYGMKGGARGVCLQTNPLIGKVTSPHAGYPSVSRCGSSVAVNLASMGAGPVAQVGQGAHSRPFPFSGGRRRTRRKSRKHKPRKHKSRKRKSHKRKSRKHKSHKRKVHRRGSRRHRGGAPQPYSNTPISFGYSLGAPLQKGRPISSESALANPPPQHVYDNCTKDLSLK